MVLTAGQKWPFVINLGNSIIGVAILTMPFCFKQCGIILGTIVMLFCTWLTLASCQLLVKAGIMSHYQSYEYLAYHTYGAAGKFLVEIGMIGMQLGTLVAQIVVIGDFGPPIVSHFFGFENTWNTRMLLITSLSLCVGLPLGLMKDLRNVSRVSAICIMFYAIFVLYVFWLSTGSLLKGDWFNHVNLWRTKGFFQCLPIMSFSFGCQTQLFILYDALPEPSLQAIKGIIHSAVNLCSVAYVLVGFLSYVTFYHLDIPGDIIMVFPATLGTLLMKVGFIISIAITFPVIIYPCRASIYTLLFHKKSKHPDIVSGTYIPEHLFRGITVAIVLFSMITAILIPNVEFVLGLNGAITGNVICYIFPALFFLRVSKPEGKTIAQIVLALGVAILLVSTFTTLYAQDKGHAKPDSVQKAQGIDLPKDHLQHPALLAHKDDADLPSNRRLEPPNPFAPATGLKQVADSVKVAANQRDDKEIQKTADGVQEPHKQEAAAVQPPDEVKRDGNIVDPLQPIVHDGAKVARQIQEVANRPGDAARQEPGNQNPSAVGGGKAAQNPLQAAQLRIDGVNQAQGLAQGQNIAPGHGIAQDQGIAQGQGVDGQPHGQAQQGQDVAIALSAGEKDNQPPIAPKDQNAANQLPQVLGESESFAGKQPAQVIIEQGDDKAPQGVGQPHGQAQQAAPAQQGGPGLPLHDAVHQAPLNPVQQQQASHRAQALPVQQKPAAMQLDRPAVAQQRVFQDRDILANRQGAGDQKGEAPPQEQQQGAGLQRKEAAPQDSGL